MHGCLATTWKVEKSLDLENHDHGYFGLTIFLIWNASLMPEMDEGFLSVSIENHPILQEGVYELNVNYFGF